MMPGARRLLVFSGGLAIGAACGDSATSSPVGPLVSCDACADDASDATVRILRRGVGGPSQAYVTIGKDVLGSWIGGMAPMVVTVPAGQRVLLDAALDGKHAAKDELVHAIYDIETNVPLKISIVS